MYFFIEGLHKYSSERIACERSEDFVAVRAKIKDALTAGVIDQDVVDRENPRIDDALEQCAMGKTKQSRAILMDVMFGVALGSDAVDDRKVNAEKSERQQDK